MLKVIFLSYLCLGMIFFKIPIVTGVKCINAQYLKILSNNSKVGRSYTKKSDFAIFQMSTRMFHIYEHVRNISCIWADVGHHRGFNWLAIFGLTWQAEKNGPINRYWGSICSFHRVVDWYEILNVKTTFDEFSAWPPQHQQL